MEHAASHAGYLTNKDAYLNRLRRIEGQARGLQKMVEDEKYCIDILTQVSAMTSALQSVALGLLDEHLNHCVVQAAAAGGDEADSKIKEASEAIARLVRSREEVPCLKRRHTWCKECTAATASPPSPRRSAPSPVSAMCRLTWAAVSW